MGLIYGRYLQFGFLEWPCIEVGIFQFYDPPDPPRLVAIAPSVEAGVAGDLKHKGIDRVEW